MKQEDAGASLWFVTSQEPQAGSRFRPPPVYELVWVHEHCVVSGEAERDASQFSDTFHSPTVEAAVAFPNEPRRHLSAF